MLTALALYALLAAPDVVVHGAAPERATAATAVVAEALESPADLTAATQKLVEWYARADFPMAHVYGAAFTGGALRLYASEGTIAALNWQGLPDGWIGWLEARMPAQLAVGEPVRQQVVAEALRTLRALPFVKDARIAPEIEQQRGQAARIALNVTVERIEAANLIDFWVDSVGAGFEQDYSQIGTLRPWIGVQNELGVQIIRIPSPDLTPGFFVRTEQFFGKSGGVDPIPLLETGLGTAIDAGWRLPRRDIGRRYDVRSLSVFIPFRLGADAWRAEFSPYYEWTVFTGDALAGPETVNHLAGRFSLGDPPPGIAARTGGAPAPAVGIEAIAVFQGDEPYWRATGAFSRKWNPIGRQEVQVFAEAGWLDGSPVFLREFSVGGLDTLPAYPEQYRFGRRFFTGGARWLPQFGPKGINGWLGIEAGDAWSGAYPGDPLVEASLGIEVDIRVLRVWIAVAQPLRIERSPTLNFRLITVSDR